ncbi:MAG: amino acid ABC transporter ATP-binding protein [Lachnospiraceae bacterium]|nr:amino acid ABC transporter ATP-binding protein [Lachnospiraceae bacterium]
MIKIEHLKKSYPDVTPLKDVSITINDGDVISVIGPSGAGKSTFLRCINLLEKPDSGDIWIGDERITDPKCSIEKIRRRVGMVFQSFNLFPHLNVIENIMLAPADLLHTDRQEAYDKGMELLQLVGLSQKALSFPEELSGGQKQRVAIARTLAMDPDMILLDEPTSALDPAMVGEVQSVIRDLTKTGRTMMIVTHEMNFARAISNRVFFMDQGGICEDGPPSQIFDNPQNEMTRRFVRRLKVLEIFIDNSELDLAASDMLITRYCFQNGLPAVLKYRIRAVFEELVGQILMPVLEDPKIQFTAEYSGEDNKVELSVRYNGPVFDPKDSENDLSAAMLKSMLYDAHHFAVSEDGYTNNFKCFIRRE